MDLECDFIIEYEMGSNKFRTGSMDFDISEDAYRKIIEGLIEGKKTINEVDGIEKTLEELRENVIWSDRYYNTNNSMRKVPLKKNRAIKNIIFSITPYEQNRILAMKNPLETLFRTEESMKIIRDDGSFVTITSKQGKVYVKDSKSNSTRIYDTELFLRGIL